MKYQICIMGNSNEGELIVKQVQYITADNLAHAYTTAHATPTLAHADIIIYPFCTVADGEGQLALASYTLKAFEKWERRNNYAVENPDKRSIWDREEYTQDAAMVILATLKDNPSATMHECKSNAFTYISKQQKAKERKSEREYMPGLGACNITPKKIKSVYPLLDRLMIKAVESADMTSGQMETLLAVYHDRKTPTEIAKEQMPVGLSAEDYKRQLETKRRTVYKTLAKAYYKLLLRMVELDKGDFEKSGFTADDIGEAFATLAKQARWTRTK